MVNSSVHFIINLAIADILKVLIDLPMTGISSFYGRWVFEDIGAYNINNMIESTY
jgi:hypothetical protein